MVRSMMSSLSPLVSFSGYTLDTVTYLLNLVSFQVIAFESHKDMERLQT